MSMAAAKSVRESLLLPCPRVCLCSFLLLFDSECGRGFDCRCRWLWIRTLAICAWCTSTDHRHMATSGHVHGLPPMYDSCSCVSDTFAPLFVFAYHDGMVFCCWMHVDGRCSAMFLGGLPRYTNPAEIVLSGTPRVEQHTISMGELYLDLGITVKGFAEVGVSLDCPLDCIPPTTLPAEHLSGRNTGSAAAALTGNADARAAALNRARSIADMAKTATILPSRPKPVTAATPTGGQVPPTAVRPGVNQAAPAVAPATAPAVKSGTLPPGAAGAFAAYAAQAQQAVSSVGAATKGGVSFTFPLTAPATASAAAAPAPVAIPSSSALVAAASVPAPGPAVAPASRPAPLAPLAPLQPLQPLVASGGPTPMAMPAMQPSQSSTAAPAPSIGLTPMRDAPLSAFGTGNGMAPLAGMPPLGGGAGAGGRLALPAFGTGLALPAGGAGPGPIGGLGLPGAGLRPLAPLAPLGGGGGLTPLAGLKPLGPLAAPQAPRPPQ